MSYADELLALAQSTLPTSAGEAEKRRCVSTAYYAVFHLIVDSAIRALVPAGNVHAQNLARRAPSHTGLRDLGVDLSLWAGQHAAVTPPKAWRNAQYVGPVPIAISELAAMVVELQTWRERADYDLAYPIGVSDVEQQADRAARAFALVQAGLPEPEWTLFLTTVLLGRARKG